MAQDPTIRYEGYVLPRDAGKRQIRPDTDPNLNYEGNTLPKDAKQFTAFNDLFNKPGEIRLNNGVQEIVLPPDTVILPDAEKIIPQCVILDGVSVFERVARKPTLLEMRGTFRMQDINGTRYNNTNPPAGALGFINNVFPQDYINDVWTYTFLPDTVLIVKNSLLNGIGIQEVIVEKFSMEPGMGTKNVGFRLMCWEIVQGPNLIISQ